MLREEIIKGLKIATRKIGGCCDNGGWLDNDEALARKSCEEAIKLLEQEPCEDAISRQAVLDALNKTSGIRGDALKALYDLPPVTPQPKMGHWIYIGNSEVNGLKIVECSECGKRTYGSGNYCPICGTKMESEE